MMIAIVILGILFIVTGLLLLLLPEVFYKIEAFFDRLLIDGDAAFGHRMVLAILLILCGLALVFVFYRYHSFVF